MKIYLKPVGNEYKIHVVENIKTWKTALEERVKKMNEGRIKNSLGKYVNTMENHEELALKTAYHNQDLEILYPHTISEEEAKKRCEELSTSYTKKNMGPMIIYGTLCPVTFVVAPFIPVLNWGVAIYFGYKFYSKYKGIKGYKKILNSKFIKESLENIIKAF